MKLLIVCYFALLWIALGSSPARSALPCSQRQFGPSKIVCVCNATYCDSYDEVDMSNKVGKFLVVTSSQAGLRFRAALDSFQPIKPLLKVTSAVFTVDRINKYQEILGFGGAFTDSTGHNLYKLTSSDARDNFLKSYFSSSGLHYSIGRVPIGGTDFSVRGYTYDDTPGDNSLAQFKLQDEDINWKIPMIKRAEELRGSPLTLYASSWSAPAWMKSNGELTGRGWLKGEHYQTYANYYSKFLKEYRDRGVSFWGITTQNEPLSGPMVYTNFNNMFWLPWWMKRWVRDNLGPTLEQDGFGNISIIIMDDQRQALPFFPFMVLSDPEAAKYIKGIGIHWYGDNWPLSKLQVKATRLMYPNYFLLYTEACTGFQSWETPKVDLGSWDRGEQYFSDIVENLNIGVVGWTDWNMALNMSGGPNWANLAADSPIIINEKEQEFYKQPMYYALGHFSRHVLPGSKVVDLDEVNIFGLEAVAVQRPDGSIVVTILNKNTFPVEVITKDPDRGLAQFTAPGKSFNTVIYQ